MTDSSGTRQASELYRAEILDHSRNPRHEGKLDAPTGRARCTNPLCGDRVTVEVLVEEDRIQKIAFKARGCALAVASASMMSEWVTGRTGEEVQTLREHLDRAVNADAGAPTPPFEPWTAVRNFPSRVSCATLPWDALQAALQGS